MEVALKMNVKEELLEEAQGEKIESICVEGKNKPLFFDSNHIKEGLDYIEKWSRERNGEYPILFAWTKSWVIFKVKNYENDIEYYDSVPRNPSHLPATELRDIA